MLAVLFRSLPSYNVRNLHAIIINYFTCFLIGTILSGELIIHPQTITASWFPNALVLSLLFIVFFNVTALTIQKVGMIITSIFQKLSLVFPVIVGLVFFNEEGSILKHIAILLTILAILLSNLPDKKNISSVSISKFWHLPLAVFIGSGLIEVIIFYSQNSGAIGQDGIKFTTALFFLAGIWGIIYLFGRRRLNFRRNEVIAGICIGIPNFFTIYLIVKALELGWEGSELFPINNVGTISITALIGILIFKEKLSFINYCGLALSIVAVLLISQ